MGLERKERSRWGNRLGTSRSRGERALRQSCGDPDEIAVDAAREKALRNCVAIPVADGSAAMYRGVSTS